MDPRLNDPSIFAGLYNLGCERLHELRYTLTSVLISPAAENVFAQVIDGKPISQSPVNHLGKRSKGLLDSSHHSKPSDLAIQQYGKIRTSLNLSVLEVDKNLIQLYQNAAERSREHDLRLLEITAAALNTLTRDLFQATHMELDLKPPRRPMPLNDKDITDWVEEMRKSPVELYHTHYQAYERYPSGLLNVVGYWAEDKLFGGVLLFDRGETGTECRDAFIHPQESFVAYRLSPRQIAAFWKLSQPAAVGDLSIPEYPLPFTAEAGAHIVNTSVTPGEPPLRFFKNDYDKPGPVPYIPYRPTEPMTQTGWKGPEHPEVNLRSRQNVEPRKRETPSEEEDDPDGDPNMEYMVALQRRWRGKYEADKEGPFRAPHGS